MPSNPTSGLALHQGSRATARSASSPTGLTRACRTSTNTSSARRSESHHLPGERVLFLEVRPGDVSEFGGTMRRRRRRRRRPSRPAVRQPGNPERDRGAVAVHPRRDRHDSSRLLRVDGGQPDCLPVEVPGVRRRGHGAGHARSPAAVGVQPVAASADPRGVRRLMVSFDRMP